MLDFESCISLEKLVLDDEACGMALRLVRGIGHGSAGEAVDLIRQVVELGSFLAHPHTRAHFREELSIPGKVVDRGTYGDWEKAGAKEAKERAAEEVHKILAKGNPAPPPEEIRRELEGIIRGEAERLGAGEMPGIS
jgi:trimethylamine--corrinoid protein Co-methyltransferase